MADEKPEDEVTVVSSVEPVTADEAAAGEAESAAESPVEPATAARPTPQEAAKAGPRFGTLGVVAAALVGVLTVVACAFAVIFGVKYYDQKQTDDDHNAAQQFVCSFARSLVTYDFNNLDQFFNNVLNETTGTLQAQFTGRQAQAVKQRVVSSQTKSSANQAGCGVVTGDGNHANVLVSLTQNVTSAGTQGQTVQMPPAAMLITATKVGGQWKASDLQGVGLPQQ